MVAADVPDIMTLIARGEGVECRFFGQPRRCPFLGDHKYWAMTDCAEIA